MKVIGMKESNFVTKEGTQIEGFNIYLTYALTGDNAKGCGCNRVYITRAKLENGGYMPELGDEVTLTYNRFGKVAAILPVMA